LPYFHPHSLRKTLTQLGGQVCQTAEEYKAWSQNLGHEQVLTTFMSYGSVATDRQGAIIRGLGSPRKAIQPGAEDFAEAVARKLRDVGAMLPAQQ
jgi:signal transduction histidine kinase